MIDYREVEQSPDRVASLTRHETISLLRKAKERFKLEPKLIEIDWGGVPFPSGKGVVFVGDTHGDFQATRLVIEKHLRPDSKVVFLGDYVDRGPQSKENIAYLLTLKLAHPENLYLLMGNHEARAVYEFHPADFWEGLDRELYKEYASTLTQLPLAATVRGAVVALHGALPDLERLEDINDIEIGSEPWRQITWGDWQDGGGDYLGDDIFTGRPQFAEGYFKRLMHKFGRKVLVRSHQPGVAPLMYGRRCLTIFTSSAYRSYVPQRTIAILEAGKEAETGDDLRLETV